MNKNDLIEKVASKANLSKSHAKAAVEAFISAVTSALKANKQVVLTGFGTFSVMKRKARQGINPATGKKMTIPAKRVPKFKPGKALKDAV